MRCCSCCWPASSPGLRGLAALPEPPEPSPIFTERVVVVGVTGRTSLTDTDRAVLDANLSRTQAGSVSIRPRYVGACAAAGWTTLGAGRRAAVGGLCDPQVSGRPGRRLGGAYAGRRRLGGATPGWARSPARSPAASRRSDPARPWRPPGPTAPSPPTRPPEEYLASGLTSPCPITLVDAGSQSDEIIRRLAADDDLTLIVTGIGPSPGSSDRSLQVFYRLGTTFPGWVDLGQHAAYRASSPSPT